MENIFCRYKAALIDMDGVLYDSMSGHTLAWKRMMDGIGVECTREEFYLYEGMTGVATINLLFQRTFGKSCSEDEARKLYDIKSRYFKEMGTPEIMPGARRMIEALKNGGLERVLVTGSGQRSLLDGLDKDYPGGFKPAMRVTANDVTKGKPDPEPYLKGASLAGVKPSDAIVVENAPLGVRAAKAAGCFTVAVTTGPIPMEEFEKEGADMIFDSMESFASFLEKELAEADSPALRLKAVLNGLEADKIFVLTDENVQEKVGADFSFADSTFAVKAGEESKNINVACELWQWLSASGATRKSVLVNFGGGVVTDLGGFVASTFKRGIRFVNFPTTLLAMADAAIGGKTGIDFNGLKNEIGVFSMPASVIIHESVLDTLSRKELISGFAEVIKMALLTDRNKYDMIIREDVPADSSLLSEVTRHAASCKEEIVAMDPREKGLRRILNLGHTAGHAFESYAAETGHPVSHGEAVAHGILVALRLSETLQGLSAGSAETYRKRVLNRYYSPLPFGPDAVPRLLELMKHDKKNCGTGVYSFVLLTEIGSPVACASVDAPVLSCILKEILE